MGDEKGRCSSRVTNNKVDAWGGASGVGLKIHLFLELSSYNLKGR